MHDSCCVFWQVRLPNMELIAKAIQLKLDFQSETFKCFNFCVHMVFNSDLSVFKQHVLNNNFEMML